MTGMAKNEELEGVIYVRVSSKEQETGHFSIPAQIDFLQAYAQEKGINIIKVYQESESAKEKGRPVFDEMIGFLKKRKKTCRLLVEKNDRLLRNEDDAALTINIATKTETEIHLVKDNMVLSKRSTPHEIMIYTIMCATSSWYPRNLSLEVQKGMNKKADLGYYPGRAPVGYKNIRSSKKMSIIEVDPEKSKWVIKAFKLYATGKYSYSSLADKLGSEGFVISKRKVKKDNLGKMLRNPFYIGDFEYRGKRYFDGKHAPLISKELFYTVQKIIDRAGSPRRIKHDFLYSTILKCEKCGSYLIGDLKKGKYLYFRCMHRGCDNTKNYLKEEHIDKKVSEIIGCFNIPHEIRDNVIAHLKFHQASEYEYRAKVIEKLESKIKTLKSRLNKLYIDKLDCVIDDEFYMEHKQAWTSELDELRASYNQMTKENDETVQKAEQLFELCKKASFWYYRQDNSKKRAFLKLLCSNFSFDGENLRITIKSTLKSLFESASVYYGGR